MNQDNKPEYAILRWAHGWTMEGIDGLGLPLTSLSESAGLFPKGSLMDAGISRHLKLTSRPDTILTIGTKAGLSRWRAEIEKKLKGLDPESAWWYGLDVGKSSECIFSVLAEPSSAQRRAMAIDDGFTPLDADDLGRCLRLVERFGWRDKMHKVADVHPNTAWPKIIARWAELEAAMPERQSAILREIHASTKATAKETA